MTAFYDRAAHMQNNISSAAAQRPSCLFVEDDVLFSSLLKQLLDKIDFAHTGSFADALVLANKGIYDFILLDLCLDDYDKHKTLQSIRKLAELSDVIILSNYGDELLAAEAIRNGAAGYLKKVDIAGKTQSQILRIIKDILNQHRASAKLKNVGERLKQTRRDLEALL